MSEHAERFPFVERAPELGVASLAPLIPLTLIAAHRVEVMGLLDTGATVSVLPFSVGTALGLDWNQQTTPIKLSGNLARSEARAAVVVAKIGAFDPVRLAFAWSRAEDVPVLLGQINFFLEFDVSFFRARRIMELRQAQKTSG